MNNRWKIVEYYIYTRTKQEDFVLKQVEVLIDAPEKAKKLCHILSGHKGAFDLAKGSGELPDYGGAEVVLEKSALT